MDYIVIGYRNSCFTIIGKAIIELGNLVDTPDFSNTTPANIYVNDSN